MSLNASFNKSDSFQRQKSSLLTQSGVFENKSGVKSEKASVKAESVLHSEADKCINFKKMLQEYRDRSEFNVAYTIMQVEDVMFVDDNTIVALEYVFYSKEGHYHKIKKEDQMKAHKHDKHHHMLGDENYMKDITKQPLSAFREEPVIFHQAKKDYLKEHTKLDRENVLKAAKKKQTKRGSQSFGGLAGKLKAGIQSMEKDHKNIKFMETVNGNDAIVEGIISLWKVNFQGQLKQKKQHSFEYDQKFQRTAQGKMQLRLSLDQSHIVLGLVNEKAQVSILAWDSKTLHPVKFSDELIESLHKASNGKKFDEITLCGNNKYLVLIEMRKDPNTNDGKDRKIKYYYFFRTDNGEKVFEFSNYDAYKIGYNFKGDQNQNLKCLGLLVKERELNYADVENFGEDDAEEEAEDDEDKDEEQEETEEESDGKEAADKNEEISEDSQEEEKQERVEEDKSGLYEIRVGGGTQDELTLLSCNDFGQVHLDSGEVQSNSQLWKFSRLKNGNYHIKVNDDSEPEKQWLSIVPGTNTVTLTDDEYFDRQQWELFKREDEDTYSIRLPVSTREDNIYLSCTASGQVEMFSKDDQSGRQKWKLESSEGLEEAEGGSVEFEGGEANEFVDNLTYVENHPLQLVFFFAQHIAEISNQYNWVMTFVNISLQDLLEKDTTPGSLDHIDLVFQEAFQKYDEFSSKAQDFFEIPKNWFIEENKKIVQWQNHIKITSNKYFSHFGLINTKKKMYLAFDNTEQKSGDGQTYFSNLEMARFNIPDQSIASHGRNQQTKRFLYLIVRVNGEGTAAHCFFEKHSKQTIKFNTDHIHATQDARVIPIADHPKDAKLEERFLLQSTSISGGDQEIMLKTMQQQNSEVSKDLRSIFRKSITQKHQGHFPVFMYNLGMKKMLIQDTLGECKSYIYELPKDEQFMDFVDYNNFEDVGFYPMKLRIEMCSNFVFLTYNSRLKRTFVNVMLIDPYYYDVQFALFKSTKFFDDKDYKKQNDVMVKNIMYCTKKKAKDTDFQVKLLTQYVDTIAPSIELKQEIPTENSEGDSDGKASVGSVSSSEAEDSEEDQDKIAVKYESVPMILNSKGDIFYVVSYDGTCMIRQILPKNDVEHREVLQLKSNKCLGFQAFKKKLFFVDDKKNIIRLKQDKETKMLLESGHLYIKNQDRPNLHILSFAELIIRDSYLINQGKIFYLHDKKAWINGILDMEDLSEIKDKKKGELVKEYANGPVKIIGSEQFVVIYRYGPDFNYKQRIYQLPDSSNISLINDQQNQTNFSTYLDDGKIFLNVGHRFVLFDKDGIFMDPVEFKFTESQSKEAIIASLNHMKNLGGKQRASITMKLNKDPDAEKSGKKEKIEDHNRMKLLGMSNDNQLYFFQDHMTYTYWVYKLVNSTKKTGGAQQIFGEQKIGFLKKNDLNTSSTTRQNYTDIYDFVPQYEVKIFESHILTDKFNMARGYDNAEEKLMDLIEKGIIKTQINDQGRVTLVCNFHEEESTRIEVWGSIFTKDSEISNFKQAVDFDPEAKSDINTFINKKERQIRNLLDIEEQIQKRLPKNFRDNDKIEDLNQQLESLTLRRQKIVQTKTQSDLLIIQCGKYIKYAKMDETMFNDDIDSDNQFTEINIQFDPGVEICQLYTTCVSSQLQIVAKDNQKQIISIVTWDTEKNIEVSCLQRKTDPNTQPENYVLKGMNRKMNYFIDKQSIFDLEFNIPIQESTIISDLKKGIDKFRQQRKIFENTSRFLGIDFPNMMYFPITRLDIIFWKSIIDLGEDSKTIQENTTLQQFTHVYNGNSLFHYFSQNVEVMEMINKKFKDAQDDDLLTDADKNVPLYLLAPDQEQNTALEIALKMQRPRCFELMVEMLQKYDQFFLTKMMLNSLPEMISNNSDTIINFFSENIYISPLMESAQLIPWPKNMDELIFASHTSIISPQIIVDQIGELIDLTKFQETMSQLKQSQFLDSLKQRTKSKKDLRSWDLNPEIDEESVMKRVRIEAIDFDWIFTGDNVEHLINLLADNANSKLFIQKSIRVFINLIWDHYKPLIVWRIFLPYLVYLACFISMSSYWAIVMLDEIDKFEEDPELIHGHQWNRIILFVLSVCISIGIVYNFKSEAQSLRRNGFFNYIEDPWNILDILSSIINVLFMVTLNINVYNEHNHESPSFLSKYQIRTFGALGTFFMWIKVFYWMRLFDFTAHYVKLILRIISDVKVFMTMLTIITLAYTNFFYIINFNSSSNKHNKEFQGEDEFNYVSEKIGNGMIDSLIGVYLIALGEFASMDSYSSGPNKISAWFMFITVTFLLLIVFMNMLIVIVSQTFETVEQQRDQLAIGEQLELIQDYIFLIDLKQKFASSKYIIRLYPDFTMKETDDIDKEEFEDLQNSIAIKHDQVVSFLQKIDTSEKNTKNMLKQQQIRMNSIQHSIELLAKKVTTQQEDQ